MPSSFAAIPAAPAVFLLRAEDPQAEPYVSKTSNLKRRLTRLLSAPEEHVRRLNLRDRVRHVEYTLTGSDFESGLLLYRTLRQVFPQRYRDRLRLRFAPLVKFNLDNPWPRAYVTPAHHRPARRFGLLRTVPHPRRCREVPERRARPVQDPPLRF